MAWQAGRPEGSHYPPLVYNVQFFPLFVFIKEYFLFGKSDTDNLDNDRRFWKTPLRSENFMKNATHNIDRSFRTVGPVPGLFGLLHFVVHRKISLKISCLELEQNGGRSSFFFREKVPIESVAFREKTMRRQARNRIGCGEKTISCTTQPTPGQLEGVPLVVCKCCVACCISEVTSERFHRLEGRPRRTRFRIVATRYNATRFILLPFPFVASLDVILQIDNLTFSICFDESLNPSREMSVVASTSRDYFEGSAHPDLRRSYHHHYQIRVPQNSIENRRLKYGHVDDDNVELAYLNFPVLWVSAFFTVTSVISFIAAVITSLDSDYIPSEQELLRGFVLKYGSSRVRCNSSIPFPEPGLPSILNLFELNVMGNVLFRYAACIPMTIRVFHAHTVRNLMRNESKSLYTSVYRVCCDLMPLLTGLEVLAMSLWSIITVHDDFPEANRFCKIAFAMTSCVNMLTTSISTFSFSSKSPHKLDSISISLKLLSTAVYCYLTPQYFQFHQSSITFPLCHSYVPEIFAMIEYAMIVAYGVFHLTSLIDVRQTSFICYPRTCGGECEPLDPRNFAKGAKFEHCRAFEFNQRRIMSL
ncbi:unnamed protein product [Caenorhabditis auriculariae]|uniref:Uncharacterized protein n=1 Tax=Caenorhabditis auriculariae TaxID=2777116 RepID=A0A8S1GYT9_9PELO|nr:unnamed protein product [Caenorhabditis auriculariae]